MSPRGATAAVEQQDIEQLARLLVTITDHLKAIREQLEKLNAKTRYDGER